MKNRVIHLLLELIDSTLSVIKSVDAFSDSGEYDFRFQENLEAWCSNLEGVETILTEKLEEED